jgi:hypothetical protein
MININRHFKNLVASNYEAVCSGRGQLEWLEHFDVVEMKME